VAMVEPDCDLRVVVGVLGGDGKVVIVATGDCVAEERHS